MNPNTPPPSDDDLPDERELGALYARLPRVEPDPALDAAVLAQATRALSVRRRPRWPVALGSAAVLVLAVGVAWQWRGSQPVIRASAPAPAPGYGVIAEHAKQVPSAAPATALQPREVEVTAARKPDASLAKSAASGRVASKALRTVATAPAGITAPFASVPATPPAPPEAVAPAAPPSPPLGPRVTATPLNAPGVAYAPAPAPPVESQPQGESADNALPPGRNGRYLPKLDLAPDDRVGEIRRLLDHGQREEALRQLRALRERYPRYELPQDLRDLKP